MQDDPLVRMPGSQPGQVTTLEGANRCLNCHADYDPAVEPGSNWQGSMMGQSARDFLFWACLTVAGQDSIWAIDRPNAVDLCERCHFPKGWLEGRSDPPNASLMTGADHDGVQCGFCHNLYDPLFEATQNLAREGDLDGDETVSAAEWQAYWDETNTSSTPSQAAAERTCAQDRSLAQAITMFHGDLFYGTDNLPASPAYSESGAGHYFVSPNGDKRASFADATAATRCFTAAITRATRGKTRTPPWALNQRPRRRVFSRFVPPAARSRPHQRGRTAAAQPDGFLKRVSSFWLGRYPGIQSRCPA